ncbi:MAG: hypothetical protein WAM80_01370, partial [Candidatus Acidiferrales bacterium]
MMKRLIFALLSAALFAAVSPSARAGQDASAAAHAERMALIGAADAGRSAAALPRQQQETAQSAQEQSEAQQDAREQAREAQQDAR